MSGGFDAQVGFVDESVYATAVAVTKFLEFTSENIQGTYERIESNSLRAGERFQRESRWAPNPKGAAGTVEFEVMSKGFAYFLKHMLGDVATAGPTETVVYTHTGTVADTTGQSFTCQVGRPDSGDTVRPFTYEGGKVTGWELSNSVDGLLMARLDMDFAREVTTGTGAYALQTASYPSDVHMLSYIGGQVSIDTTDVDVYDASVRVDNGLKTDRYFLNASGGAVKREPLESALRQGEVSLTLDFDGMTHYNRVLSATAAGAQAEVELQWAGEILTGATTLTSLVTVTIPEVRFDGATPTVNSPELLQLPLSGKVLAPASGSPITIEVKTLEATV